MLHSLIRFFKSPYANMVIGSLLIITGGLEVIRAFEEVGHEIGSEHGVAIFGIYTMLRSVTEIIDGLERAEEGLASAEGDSH